MPDTATHPQNDLLSTTSSSAPEYTPWTLPAPLNEICTLIPTEQEYPPLFLISAILVTACGIIGNKAEVCVAQGWNEPFSLFIALIAESGKRKNNAVRFATAPAYTIHRGYTEHNKKVIEAYQVQLADYNKAVRSRSEGIITTHVPPAPPQVRSLIVQDATGETIPRIMESSPNGILMPFTELTTLTKGFNAYKSAGRGSDENIAIHGWDYYSPITVNRGGSFVLQPAINIEKPRISIIGPLTPENTSQFCVKYADSGLAPRFLFACADYQPLMELLEKETLNPSEHLNGIYANIINRLTNIPEGTKLAFDPDGKTTFRAFYHDVISAIQAPQGPLRGSNLPILCLNKLAGITARIAGTLALLQNPETTSINLLCTEEAIYLAKTYMKSINYITHGDFNEKHQQGSNIDERILSAIQRTPNASARQLYRNAHISSILFSSHISALIKNGVVIEKDGKFTVA